MSVKKMIERQGVAGFLMDAAMIESRKREEKIDDDRAVEPDDEDTEEEEAERCRCEEMDDEDDDEDEDEKQVNEARRVRRSGVDRYLMG